MIDPRAYSETKLETPEPLPYISRRALKRVRVFMGKPETCPYCGGKVELVGNWEIYNGREYGDWPYAYLCRPCDAYVGLHPGTDLPLGTLARVQLREKRKAGKIPFNKLWQHGYMSRGSAYKILAERMNIPLDECHWAWFNEDECEDAMYICDGLLREYSSGSQI